MRRYPAGPYGKKVLWFDGVDDYVVSGYSGSPSEFTLEALIAPEPFPDAPWRYMAVVVKRGAVDFGGLWVERTLDHFLFYLRGADGASYNLYFGTPRRGVYTYIVGVLKGKTMYAYENGVLRGTLDFPTEVVVGDTRWSVVANEAGDWNLLKGSVAMVRIYNRALSEDEIRRLRNDAFNLRPASIRDGLVLEFIPDTLDCANGVWRDNSGYGNDGTIYGARCIAI